VVTEEEFGFSDVLLETFPGLPEDVGSFLSLLFSIDLVYQ
jgi:hypothetical protein